MQASKRTLAHVLIASAIIALLIAYAIPACRRIRDRADLATCADHLRAIGVSVGVYARICGGDLPLTLTVDGPHADLIRCLASAGCAPDEKLFYCPAETRAELQFSHAHFKAGIFGYFWFAAQGVTENPELSKFLRTGMAWPHPLNIRNDPRSWVMSDLWISGAPTSHAGYRKGVNYLMLDGSVAFLTQSPRQAFH